MATLPASYLSKFIISIYYLIRVRSNLLDESLEAELICSVTELEPDYMKLIKEIESQISN